MSSGSIKLPTVLTYSFALQWRVDATRILAVMAVLVRIRQELLNASVLKDLPVQAVKVRTQNCFS